MCSDKMLGVRAISRECKALFAECEVTSPHLDYDAKGGRFGLTVAEGSHTRYHNFATNSECFSLMDERLDQIVNKIRYIEFLMPQYLPVSTKVNPPLEVFLFPHTSVNPLLRLIAS